MDCREARRCLGRPPRAESGAGVWARAEEHAAGCADCRAYVESLQRVDAMLAASLTPDTAPAGFTARVVAAVSPRRLPGTAPAGLRPALAWALAASAIALLAATASNWRSGVGPQGIATVVASQGVGQVLRAGGAETVAPGALVQVGDAIATEPGGSVCLCFADGSCVTVQGGTTIRIVGLPQAQSPAQLDLQRGLITSCVQRVREMLVRTPCATASAEGTRFCLNATDDQSCLTVREGQAALANDHGQVNAVAMQHASATRTAAPEAPVDARIPESGGH